MKLCKNNRFLFLSPFILIFMVVSCQKSTKEFTINKLKNDVYYLASDQLEGRETGSEGEKWAANYIVNRFRQNRVIPYGTNGSYFQEFEFRIKNDPHDTVSSGKMGKGTNVIGFIDHKADYTVVVGAHYDHLGYGDENSLYKEGKAIHNGADDNASGVAGLLCLSDILVKRNKNNNYLLIAFSGEEKGLFGSNFFTKNPTIDLTKVNYMINMDMIGRMDSSRIALFGTGTSPVWKDLIREIHMDSLFFTMSDSGVGPSDHTSFYLQDIPVLHFFTGQHEDYHKPSDDADKINYEGIYTVVAMIDSIITRLDPKGKIEFTKTSDQDSRKAPKFSVTLGVVPDYMFDGTGMRIDGVSEGKPAQRAGMIKGDVVIQMGDLSIKDMMSYMEALSSFKKGDKTKVLIVRSGKEMEVEVEF